MRAAMGEAKCDREGSTWLGANCAPQKQTTHKRRQKSHGKEPISNFWCFGTVLLSWLPMWWGRGRMKESGRSGNATIEPQRSRLEMLDRESHLFRPAGARLADRQQSPAEPFGAEHDRESLTASAHLNITMPRHRNCWHWQDQHRRRYAQSKQHLSDIAKLKSTRTFAHTQKVLNVRRNSMYFKF